MAGHPFPLQCSCKFEFLFLKSQLANLFHCRPSFHIAKCNVRKAKLSHLQAGFNKLGDDIAAVITDPPYGILQKSGKFRLYQVCSFAECI